MSTRTIFFGVARSFLLFVIFVSAPVARASYRSQTESPAGWVEVRSPHFIVVSNAGEDQAQQTAQHFEEIRAVFRTALPFASTHESPVITVLALRDEASMQELLPDFWEKGHVRNAGLFVQRLGKAYIVLRLDLVAENSYETIYHEYFHSVTTPYYTYLPLWLSEGLAEFFGNAEINAKDVTLGRVNASLLRQLNGKTLIGLPTLFRVDHASQYYNEQERTSLFYAESWALTHYLLVGDDVSRHSAIANYLKALQHGVPQEKAAQQAFGDLNVLAQDLVRYLGSSYFREVRMKSTPEFESTGYQTHMLSDAESAAIRGNFSVYRGRPAIAKPLVDEALRDDPNLALAHETRGVMEYLDGHRPAALAEINRAVALDPQNYLTRFLRATLMEEDDAAYQTDDSVESDLRRSIQLNPDYAGAYGFLASYLAGQKKDLPEALSFAEKAADLEPGTWVYQFDLAEVLLRLNRPADAVAAGNRAITQATRPEDRERAKKFLADMRRYNDAVDARPPVPKRPASKDAVLGDATLPSADASSPGMAEQANASAMLGKVLQEKCTNDGALQFSIGAAHGPIHFATGPRGSFALFIPDYGFPANFNACKDLTGQRVQVGFIEGKAPTTTTQVITISVMAVQPPASLPPPAIIENQPASRLSAEGTVALLSCEGKKLSVAIQFDQYQLLLRTMDFTKISFSTVKPAGPAKFNPCTQLRGRRVRADYAPVESKLIDGNLLSVTVKN
jgi:tetratricopeptide (TPR) repeat protein